MASDPSSNLSEQSPIAKGDKPRDTLLRTAATARPLDEFATLVNLLKQNGESPSPGDEALRMAAVGRPVDEVRQLIALLNEPPHAVDDADTALRAAAMGRPIEEVAQLVSSFSPGDSGQPSEQPRTRAVVEPAAGPVVGSAPVTGAPRRPEPAAEAAAKAGAVSLGRPVPSSMRSVLRWPAAVALLVIGAIHLPTDIAGLRSGDTAAGASLVIAVLCLVLAFLLAAQDTVWIWAASATAAVGTLALHSLAAGFGSVHLLRDSLGNSFAGSTTAALVCAVLAAGLAASALLRRQKPAAVANDA